MGSQTPILHTYSHWKLAPYLSVIFIKCWNRGKIGIFGHGKTSSIHQFNQNGYTDSYLTWLLKISPIEIIFVRNWHKMLKSGKIYIFGEYLWRQNELNSLNYSKWIHSLPLNIYLLEISRINIKFVRNLRNSWKSVFVYTLTLLNAQIFAGQ